MNVSKAELEGAFANQLALLQSLFFPEGFAYDEIRFNRTAVTAPLFNYLVPSEDVDEKVVSPVGIDHGKARPKADAVWLISPGEP